MTAKRLSSAIQRVFRRRFLQEPCHRLIREIKNNENRANSKLIIADLLEKRGLKLMSDSLFHWRRWVELDKIEDIKANIDSLD